MEASNNRSGDDVGSTEDANESSNPSSSDVFHLSTDIIQDVSITTVDSSSSSSIIAGNTHIKHLVVGKRVTRIPYYAFQSWSQLESVKIFSPVMDIGMSAFAGHQPNNTSSLKIMDLSSCHIVRLGPTVFQHCTSLEQIIFSETCSLVELNEATFQNCRSLKNIRLPTAVKTIMQNCFENCQSLTSFQLPNGLVDLGDTVFHGCSFLEKIDVPRSITQIKVMAFSECHRLKSVKLHEGLRSIADFAFAFCFALEKIHIPNTMVTIGYNCFESCTSLVTVELPPLLKRIDDGVFADCTSLKRVWVPPSLESIGYHTFWSCSNLVSLVIPQKGNLLSVNTHALEGCINLRNTMLPPKANPRELTFSNCHSMMQRTENGMDLLEALQNRFEGLAVHDLCYGRRDLTVRELEDALSADSSNYSVLRRDKLGLNLLQVLLLSFHPKREILLYFIKKYPTCLIPDSFGARLTIDVNVQRAMEDLCHLDDFSTIQDVLEVSLSNRVKMLGLQKWKNSVCNLIGSLSSSDALVSRQNAILRILSNMESCERLETTSLLELAVWKVALVNGSSLADKDCREKLTMGERVQIRVTNGSNVVIPQVTAFLWDVDVD